MSNKVLARIVWKLVNERKGKDALKLVEVLLSEEPIKSSKGSCWGGPRVLDPQKKNATKKNSERSVGSTSRKASQRVLLKFPDSQGSDKELASSPRNKAKHGSGGNSPANTVKVKSKFAEREIARVVERKTTLRLVKQSEPDAPDTFGEAVMKGAFEDKEKGEEELAGVVPQITLESK
eukprot:TRINITY_DN17753_c0_g2_i2.p2 TRINITY_DN17753_c0_g2~~TRINITY_DN17753_c0_g2_i2.p2  ORF type:complete len:178 (-),score=50.11 TRINITY_DN17753_c0_g2_i2:161-694(-)